MKTWVKVLLGGSAVAVAVLYVNMKSHHDYERYVSVEPGDVVLDVGAGSDPGFPSFSFPASKKASLVVALEPNPIYAEELLKAGIPNLVVVEKGAWNSQSTLRLHLAGVCSSVLENGEVPVQVDTIDSIVSQMGLEGKIDFIKMDIEGAEIEALQGSENTLANARKVVIAAYHKRDGVPTYLWVKPFLESRGFKTALTYADMSNGLGLVHAWRQ